MEIDHNLTIRKKLYLRWIAFLLRKHPSGTKLLPRLKERSLERALSDGTVLALILEVLNNKVLFTNWNAKPRTLAERTWNVRLCLDTCGLVLGDHDFAEKVADCDELATCSLMLKLALKYHMGSDERFEVHQEILKLRLQERGLDLANFSSDFRFYPTKFATLINVNHPGAVNMNKMIKLPPKKIISYVLDVAEARFGIPRLLDTHDVLGPNPDAISNYIYCGFFIEKEGVVPSISSLSSMPLPSPSVYGGSLSSSMPSMPSRSQCSLLSMPPMYPPPPLPQGSTSSVHPLPPIASSGSLPPLHLPPAPPSKADSMITPPVLSASELSLVSALSSFSSKFPSTIPEGPENDIFNPSQRAPTNLKRMTTQYQKPPPLTERNMSSNSMDMQKDRRKSETFLILNRTKSMIEVAVQENHQIKHIPLNQQQNQRI